MFMFYFKSPSIWKLHFSLNSIHTFGSQHFFSQNVSISNNKYVILIWLISKTSAAAAITTKIEYSNEKLIFFHFFLAQNEQKSNQIECFSASIMKIDKYSVGWISMSIFVHSTYWSEFLFILFSLFFLHIEREKNDTVTNLVEQRNSIQRKNDNKYYYCCLLSDSEKLIW